MTVHLLFRTPFLVFVALYGTGLVLYSTLLESRLRNRPAIASRWRNATGTRWPWWVSEFAVLAGVVGVLVSLSVAMPHRTAGITFFPILTVMFAVLATSMPRQWLASRHNKHLPPLLPAGWFADCHESGVERYWDGSKWTAFCRDAETGVAVDRPESDRALRDREVPTYVW